jgi:hypothetical protein
MARRYFWVMGLVILLTMASALPAWAVPGLLSFQGKLTDSVGDALNGTFSMTFRLFNVESDGSSIWDETQTVDVRDGIYSVQLGTLNPLNESYFGSASLYLEVVVEGETLSPRQLLTSAAFAMKSGDADTLDGLDSADLDQSAHATDTENPHSVTSAQIGAATNSDLSSHAADTSAHHNKITSFTELIDTATDAQIPNNITINYATSADNANFALAAGNADFLDNKDSSDFALKTHSHIATAITSGTLSNLRFSAYSDLVSEGYLDNTSGDVAQNNGFLQPNLNADKLDGLHATAFVDKSGDAMSGPLSVPSLQIDGMTVLRAENSIKKNTFLGLESGYSNTGNQNTFFGYRAGEDNLSGSRNIFVGSEAGSNNLTGHHNIFVGTSAGSTNTEGTFNTFVGDGAGSFATKGHFNVSVGQSAGYELKEGLNNTFVGAFAGHKGTGNYNTSIGYGAGSQNVSGNSNVFLGNEAGYSETGSDKLYVANSDTDTPLIYGEFDTQKLVFNGQAQVTQDLFIDGNVGIGTAAPATKLEVANLIRIGGSTWPTNGEGLELAYNPDLNRGYVQAYDRGSGGGWGELYLGDGNVGIGVGSLASGYKLTVIGSAAKTGGGEWSTYSDVRLKDVTGSYEYGLEQIVKIHPVKYRYKDGNGLGLASTEEYVGLIAQEVMEVIPEAVEENESGYLMVNGTPISYAMLNAIKELSAEVKRLKNRIEELERR